MNDDPICNACGNSRSSLLARIVTLEGALAELEHRACDVAVMSETLSQRERRDLLLKAIDGARAALAPSGDKP